MAAINIDVGANTRQAEKDIQKLVSKNYTLNLKTKGTQPLGRITGEVNEFTKSLDASNARVIAFGASAGIIFGVQRAFQALVTSTIDVQKSLQDINVILNVSSQQLNKFGSELFNIARNTGQSFSEVAKAATEFSRQGLGVEETLKRTSDALILSRLSGLDAAKSVDALTAAVNSFASQAVTTTEIVNKFANVDAAFAVSSEDLAEAISRVGSSAAQSGVSLNELISIVTSAQQTTARGGAVIGNSFKTIFTRLQRGKVVNLLESLGVDTTDAGGNIKSTIQLLQDLAKVYDDLGTLQQAEVAEKVGGVFQINILKAALSDLGKEYSTYNSALQVAASSTDQAIKRNEELNKTYAAQLNALSENAKQLGGNVGTRLLGPLFDRTVGNANEIFKGINESDGQGIGATLGKGILDGLGQVIAGPGLALIGGIFIKLFADLSKFAGGSVKDLLGLNNATKQQADLQKSVSEILARNPALIQQMGQGTAGVNKLAETLLNTLRAQTAELQKQQQVASQVATILAQGGVKIAGGVPVAPAPGKPGKPGKAAGFIPNFARDPELLAARGENYSAQRSFDVNNPVLGKIRVNNREKTNAVPVGNYPAGSFVVNPNQLSQVRGIPLTPIERMKNKASGFIPNFAKSKTEKFTDFGGKYAYLVPFGLSDGTLPTEKIGQYKVGGIPIKSPKKVDIDKYADKDSLNLYKNIEKVIVDEAFKYTNTIRPLNKGVNFDTIKSKFETTAGAAGALKGAAGAAFEVGIISALDYESASRRGDVAGNFDIRGGANLAKIQDLFDLRPSVGLADFKVNADPSNIKKFYDKVRKEEKAGVFDDREQTRNINRDAEVEVARQLAKDENLKKWVIAGNKISAKAPDFVKKMVEERKNLIRPRYNLASFPKGPIRAAGYIPNFAAKMKKDAERQESKAGIPKSTMYFSQEEALADVNPLSLGLFNTIDEPDQKSRDMAMRNQGFAAKGYIPNFAQEFNAETPGTAGGAGLEQATASLTSTISALAIQLSSLVFTFQLTKDEYAKSINDLTEANKKAGKAAPGRLQKAGEFAKANALGLTFAAPIIGQTIAPFAKQFATERFGAKAGRTTESAITGGTNALALTAGASLITKNPKFLGLTLLASSALGLVDVFKQLNTNLPELTDAAIKASSSFTQFTEAAGRIRTASERIQELRFSGDRKGAAKEQLKLEQELLKTEFKTPELQAQAISGLRNLNFKSLEQALNENTQALLKDKEATEAAEKVTSEIEAGKFGEVGKTLLNQAQQEFLKGQLETGVRQDFDFGQYGADINKIISDLNRLGQRGNPQEGRGQLKQNIIDQLANVPGLDFLQKALSDGGLSAEEVKKSLEALAKASEAAKKEQDELAKRLGEGNPAAQAIKNSLDNARTAFADFATNAQFAVQLQSKLNDVIKKAASAVKINNLQNQSDIFETLGATDLARQFSIEAEVGQIQSDFSDSISEPLRALNDELTKIQFGKVEEGLQPSLDKNDVEKGLKDAQAASIENINNLIKTIDKSKLGEGTFTEDSAEGTVKSIVDSVTEKFPDIQEEDLKEITSLAQTLVGTTKEARVLQEQQLRVLAQNKTAELVKQLIQATQKAFGGLEGFRNAGPDDAFGQSLFDLREGIADVKNIRSGGPVGPEGNIEKGRAFLKIADSFAQLFGRTLQDVLNTPGGEPLQEGILSARTTGLEKEINTIFAEAGPEYRSLLDNLIENLAPGVETVGKSGDQLAKAIQEAAQKIAIIQIGDAERSQGLLKSFDKRAVETITSSFGEKPTDEQKKFLDILKDDPNKANFTIQEQLYLETVSQTQELKNILSAIQNLKTPPSSTQPVTTKAAGFIPAFAKERGDIKRGVGGAKVTDYPMFVPNLNGSPAVVNSGEQLVPNFANTGKTAVLTREMQKAMGMAKGFIPNFAPASPELINKLLNMVRNGTPPERKNALAALRRFEKAGKLPPGVLSGAQVPPTTTPEAGPILALPGPAGRPPKPVPLPNPNAFSKVAKKIPYVGIALTGASAFSDYQNKTANGIDPTEAAVRAALETGLGYGGAIMGAKLMGLLGLPTGPGALVAAGVGGYFGYEAGSMAGRGIGDLIYGPEADLDFTGIQPRKIVKPAAEKPRAEKPTVVEPTVVEPKVKLAEIPKIEEAKEKKEEQLKEKEDRAKQRADELRNNMLRYAMGAEARFKQYNPDGEYTGVTDIYGPGGGGYEKDSVIAATKSDLSRRIQELKQRREEAKGFPGSDEVGVGISRQIVRLQEALNKTLRESRASQYRGSVIEGAVVETYSSQLPFKGKPIENPQNVTRIITDAGGQVVGTSRNKVAGVEGTVNGLPLKRVLEEGRAAELRNRPSDPAYDKAMLAAGLDPKTGAPIKVPPSISIDPSKPTQTTAPSKPNVSTTSITPPAPAAPRNPQAIVEEQLARAAQVSAGLATSLGLNIGEEGKKPFGAEGRRPEVQIYDEKRGDRADVEFRDRQNPLVRFKGGVPTVGTLFNEATNLNQSQRPGVNINDQLPLVQNAIREAGGFNAVDKRQKQVTDFIIQQNESAKKPFTTVGNAMNDAFGDSVSSETKTRFTRGKDTRMLGGITSEYMRNEGSPEKPIYNIERNSTLIDNISRGVAAGEITAQEIQALGVKEEEAKRYVAEIGDIDKKLKEAKTYSRGFIPNFAPKLDPKQLKDAVDAERMQAPPGAIPALGFNKGNPDQPFIYDARTQTEESAIRDHGGYRKGFQESKARRNDDPFGNNMVANLAYNKRNNRSQNTSPVFNINFSPQNTTTYSEGFVPNFANQKGIDYEKMMNEMKSDMEKRWQQAVQSIQPIKEVVTAGQRNGALPYNKPKFMSTSLKF